MRLNCLCWSRIGCGKKNPGKLADGCENTWIVCALETACSAQAVPLARFEHAAVQVQYTLPTFAMATRYAHVLLQTTPLYVWHACTHAHWILSKGSVWCARAAHMRNHPCMSQLASLAIALEAKTDWPVQFNRAEHQTSTRVHTHGTQR
jgi:hypothetical protein